jgi:phosphonate transport system substrate-binding protein
MSARQPSSGGLASGREAADPDPPGLVVDCCGRSVRDRYAPSTSFSCSETPLSRLFALLAAAVLSLSACGAASGANPPARPPLVIGGIPDQDVALLDERFGRLAEYLSQELGFPVRYQPMTDYAAVVTAFVNGDVMLGWFGGLTGVQARLETPGAEAVAQRPVDREFRSVFVVGSDLPAERLEDLAGKTFTFGSESSTSGHLMPRFFLGEAGIDPDDDLDGRPSYSGSHDKTWKLVEAGSFQAGALNAAVWDRAVEEGQVDTSRVREVARSSSYVDYHWVAHPRVDEVYGAGTKARIVEALLGMDEAGPEAQRILELFGDDSFVAAENGDYRAVEQVARSLRLIEH